MKLASWFWFFPFFHTARVIQIAGSGRGGNSPQWTQSFFKAKKLISMTDQEKIMGNFHGSWFLALEFPSGLTHFCGISKGEAKFCLKFPRQINKFLGFLQKSMSSIPSTQFDLFWNSPLLTYFYQNKFFKIYVKKLQ